MHSHGLNIFDQGLRGVFIQMVQIVLDDGSALATTALVKADNPESGRVMALTVAASAKGAARAAVKVKNWDASRFPRGFPIDSGIGHAHPAALSL